MSNRPWIAPRFVSHFLWSRPAIPWDIADELSTVLNQSNISSIGVTGSLHPSILISVAYGTPDRAINTFAYISCWDEAVGWDYVIEDSPGMEKTHPYTNVCLPVSEGQLHFWDGATPFFNSEALFIDLPFNHAAVKLQLPSLSKRQYKLIVLGFMDTFDEPTDVYEWAQANGYVFEETIASIKNPEKGISVNYKLLIGRIRPAV